MEPRRDDQLAADLRALRPTPRPEFAAELDERAAAGFPRRRRLLPKSPPDLFAAMRNKGPAHPWRLLPAAGLAVLVLGIAVSAGLMTRDDSSPRGGVLSSTGPLQPAEQVAPAPAPEGAAEAIPNSSVGSEAPFDDFSGETQDRAVERSAEIVLGANPEDVADDAAKVFAAVHAHRGIVLRSSTEEGAPGEAGASFELLIPSDKLGDALAAFSAIDEVRSRHEATADITAPTVTTEELLQESKARIDSLLSQLGEATTESEREAVEAELRQERQDRSRLRTDLQNLERRADFSRVSLRIETGASEDSSVGGPWGIDDALHDAGQVLTVAAAVALIVLAILGPIALIALLAWLTHRAWVRRERRRVLS